MNNNSENFKSIFATIISTISCGIIIGMFKMYTDMELMKIQVHNQEKALERQQVFSERIDQTLQTLDKTLALQAQTVQALQESLDKLGTSTTKRK